MMTIFLPKQRQCHPLLLHLQPWRSPLGFDECLPSQRPASSELVFGIRTDDGQLVLHGGGNIYTTK